MHFEKEVSTELLKFKCSIPVKPLKIYLKNATCVLVTVVLHSLYLSKTEQKPAQNLQTIFLYYIEDQMQKLGHKIVN